MWICASDVAVQQSVTVTLARVTVSRCESDVAVQQSVTVTLARVTVSRQ